MNDTLSPAQQAADAEQALLGAVLAGYRDVDELAGIVFPTSFWQPKHEQIWSAILSVIATGAKPDPIRVRMALDANSHVDPTYLVTLSQACPFVADAAYYAQQVADAALRRRLADAAKRINQISTSTLTADEMREIARREVDEATEAVSVTKAIQLVDVLPETLDVAQHGRASCLGTGWDDLDRIIQGVSPGRFIVVGARPGVGKSIMGANLAKHMAHHHGHAVLFCSMEMPQVEVAQRIIAAHAGVNLTTLENGTVDERGWGSINSRYAQFSEMPITIDDRANQTLNSIRSQVRHIRRKRDDLALIVVDYLQLMRPSDSRASRVEQIGEISRGLKLIARESGACVVAMAQVNRESVKSRDGKPRMSDLRESGAIEADADIVILLHQPDEKLPEIEVMVEKNRSGPRGVCTLQIQGHYARLVSTAWTPGGAA